MVKSRDVGAPFNPNLETFDEKLTTIEALGQSISKLFGIGVDSFVPVDLSRMPKFLGLVGQNLIYSRVTVANWYGHDSGEEIEDCDDANELQAMQMSIQTQYDDKIKRIAELFETDDGVTKIKTELESTRYYQRILDEIELKAEQMHWPIENYISWI